MFLSDDISEIATALAKAQGEIENATKGSENPHFRSKYADLAAIRDAIRAPLSKHGIAYVQGVRIGPGFLEVETVLMHTSGQRISEILAIPVGGQMTAQTIGSASTYAKRYGLMGLLGLAGGDDDDGNAATDGVRGKANGSLKVPPIDEAAVLSDEQLGRLRGAIVTAGIDISKVLEYAKVEHLEEIPARHFDKVLHAVEQRRPQA